MVFGDGRGVVECPGGFDECEQGGEESQEGGKAEHCYGGDSRLV